MATELETLVVRLEAQMKAYERELKKQAGTTDSTLRTMERRFEHTEGVIASFGRSAFLPFIGGLAAGAASALSFEKIIGGTIMSLAKLGDQADRIGLSTDALQAMRFELAQNGAEADDANKAMDRFADKLGDAARGQGDLHKWFEANNVSIKTQTGSLRSLDEMLDVTARLMAGLETQQEKVNFVTDIFGRQAGPRMIGMLERIAKDGLANVTQNAKDIGVVVDKELVKKAQEIEDAWDKMTTQLSTWMKSRVVTSIQEVGGWLSWLDQAVTDFYRNLPGGKKLVEAAQPAASFADRWSAMGSPMRKFVPPGSEPPKTKSPMAEAKGESKDAIDREEDRIKKRIELLNAEVATLGKTTEERERARAEAELWAAVEKSGIAITDELLIRISYLADQWGEAAAAAEKAKDKFKAIEDAAKEFGSAVSDAFKGMVLEGKSLNEVLDQMTKRLASKAIDRMFDMLLFGGSGGKLNGGGLFGGLFGGFRAAGGPVDAGKSYIVGERGPELVRFGKSGMVTPNRAIAGGVGGTSIRTGDLIINGNVGPDELPAIRSMLSRQEREIKNIMRGARSSQHYQATGVRMA